MREIVWGIIGCGDVCEMKSGPAFNRVPGSRLAAVMRRDGAKAADFARRHGVSRHYDDANELLDDPEINAVYVATPPSTHREAIEAAAIRGIPVLVEKPISDNVADAAAAVTAAMSARIPLVVAYFRRALPRFEKVRELLQSGAIGRVEAIRVTQVVPEDFDPPQAWKLDPTVGGGGLFFDMQSHTLDWLRYVFGRPTEVHGVVRGGRGDEGSERLVAGTIVWERGPVASILCIYAAQPAEESVRVIGCKGSIEMGFFRPSPIYLKTALGTEEIDLPDPPHCHEPFIARVVEHFREQGPNPCSGDDGLAVNRILDRLFEGRPD